MGKASAHFLYVLDCLLVMAFGVMVFIVALILLPLALTPLAGPLNDWLRKANAAQKRGNAHIEARKAIWNV